MNVALFFGSFNPIHVGHLILAQSALNFGGVEKVWFVVSPRSPDKSSPALLHEFDRFDLAYEATRDNPDFRVLDVEFHLPRPSYTYLTLRKLCESYPGYRFSILMGSDNFQNLSRWKNADEIRRSVRFLVYPRPGHQQQDEQNPGEGVTWLPAPMLQVSATEIRNLIRTGRSVRYLIPENACRKLEEKGFYR